MNKSTSHNQSKRPTQDQIAAAAYQLYLESGSQPGNDLQNWLKAEQMLTQATQPAATQSNRPQTEAQSADHDGNHDGNSFHSRLNDGQNVQPLHERDNPLARNERNTASRDEIRHIGIPPAARQSQRRTERSRAASR